jgi:hypothetical protein
LLLGQGDQLRREVVLIDTFSGIKQRVDFFRRSYGEAYWDIVALKAPHKRAFTRRGIHVRPSGAVYDAINQAQDYRALIDGDPLVQEYLERKGLPVFRPKILVVVGRSDPTVSGQVMRDLRDRLSQGVVEFRTYDDLHRFATEHYRAQRVLILPVSLISRSLSRPDVLTESSIHRILADCPGLTNALAASLIEALAVSHGGEEIVYEVRSWRGTSEVRFRCSEPNPRARAAWANDYDCIEAAATAISMLVMRQELQLVVCARAELGTGADYYLRSVAPMSDTFDIEASEDLVRLELSATKGGGADDIRRRARMKLRSLQAGHSKLPGMVSVVGLSARVVEIARTFQEVEGTVRRHGSQLSPGTWVTV